MLSRFRIGGAQHESLVMFRRYGSAGAEPQKFDCWPLGSSKLMLEWVVEVIRTQHICLSGVLHPHLRAIKRETLALNFTPDLFMAVKVRVRLAHLHGEDLYGDDTPDCGQTVPSVEEAVGDVGPVTARSWIGKR